MNRRLILILTLLTPQMAWASADLVVQSRSVSSTNVEPGDTINASCVIANVGSSSAGRSKIKYYLSSNTSLDGSDTFLKGDLVGILAAGATSPEDADVVIPAGTAAGTWYVLFVADANSEVSESNESNNVSYRQINVTGPDLVVESPQVSSSTVVSGETITGSCTVRNAGSAPAGGNRLYYYLSNNTTYSPSDTFLRADIVGSLTPGATSPEDASLIIPEGTAAGTWYILYRVDPSDEVPESNENNNVAYKAITVAAPDLVVQSTAVSNPTPDAGDSLNVSCVVKNVGSAVAGGNRIYYYLSGNTTYNTGDTFLKADIVDELNPGATRPEDANVDIPESTPAGIWYILYRVDPGDEVPESNEGNNVAYRQITIGSAPAPDLVVGNAALSTATAQPGDTVHGSCQVENVGVGNAASSTLKYYLSQDASYDAGDIFLKADLTSSLGPGQTSPEDADLIIPATTTAGTWYVLFRADANQDVSESNESNNTSSVILTVGGASVFSDLPADHWAYPAALYLYQEGLLEPDAGGHVRPADDTLRAELAKLAFLGAEIPPYADNYPNPFNDLQERNVDTEWYYSYAKNLSYLEFGDGVSAFTRDRFNFYPSQTISRAHTLKVLIETWDIPVLTGGSVPYSDVSTGHDAYDYIYTAYQRGIIDGSASTFRPDDQAIRAEIFVMLHNVMVGQAIPAPAVTVADFFTTGNYTPANLGLRRSLQNGNFEHYTKTSFTIPGFNLPMVFAHRYNSYLTELQEEFFALRPLGHGWSHSYNSYILSIDGYLVVFWPNGAMHVYDDRTGTLEKVTQGNYDEITRVSATRFTIKKKNQVVYTFDRLSGTAPDFPYVLTKISDRNNKSIGLFYESSQRPDKTGWRRLWKVTGTGGREITFAYHPGSDLVQSAYDPLNRVVRFAYSSSSHDDADLTTFTDAKGQITRYSYNTAMSAKHLLRYIFLPEGNVVTNQYEERKLRSTRRGTQEPVNVDLVANYNQAGNSGFNLATVTREGRNPVQYSHQRDGMLESVVGLSATDATLAYDDPAHPTLPTTFTGADGVTLDVTYDQDGNVLRIDRPLAVSEILTYNGRNDVTSYTDPRGKVTHLGYDASGNLTSITDPLLNVTGMTYDSSGLVMSITSPSNVATSLTYDAYGNLTGLSAPLGISSAATYDLAGRRKTATNPLGIVTNYSYDANDNVTMVSGPSNVSFGYNSNDLLESITDATGVTTSLGYNDEDLLSSMSFQGGSIGYEYFEDGLLSTRTDPDGVATTFSYDDYGRLLSDNNGNSYTYDAKGNLKTATNGMGQLTFFYDALNRLDYYTDPFGNQVGYAYDKAGHMTAITYPGNLVVQYVYRDDGRLDSVEDWQGNVTSYSYRPDGQLNMIQYPNGVDCTYGYDLAGRLVSLVYQGSSAGVIASYAFTLDDAGNHVSVTKTEPLDDSPIAASSTTMAYDEFSRILSANGVTFSHDANGLMTRKGTRNYQYDRQKRLTGITGDVTASYSYDALGYRRQSTVNGVTRRYVLDITGRLDNLLVETDGAGNPVNRYVHAYGLLARIDAMGSSRNYHFDYRGSTVALTDPGQLSTHEYSYAPYGGVVRTNEEDENRFKFVGRFGVQQELDDLYYMRARYYDNSLGRFLGVDPVWSTNRYNYAASNPTRWIDPTGRCNTGSREGDSACEAVVGFTLAIIEQSGLDSGSGLQRFIGRVGGRLYGPVFSVWRVISAKNTEGPEAAALVAGREFVSLVGAGFAGSTCTPGGPVAIAGCAFVGNVVSGYAFDATVIVSGWVIDVTMPVFHRVLYFSPSELPRAGKIGGEIEGFFEDVVQGLSIQETGRPAFP